MVGYGEPTIPQEYSRPSILKRLFELGTHVLPKSYLRSSAWVGPAQKVMHRSRKKDLHVSLLADIGINAPVVYYEHHFLHAITAHLMCPWGKEENLVITNDGSGDAVAATVSVGRGNKLDRLATISNYNSLGELYTRVTQYLSMKPMSHEYKVMGLAAYAKEEYGKKAYELIRNWFRINPSNPLVFENHSGAWRWQYLEKLHELFFTRHRFDNISWAVQHLVEELQTEWIQGVVNHTGLRRVVLCGGVFLNVKANLKLLQEIENVDEIFFFPSGGDECLAMGAALQRSVELGCEETSPLRDLYLGDEFSDEEIRPVLESYADRVEFVEPADIHEAIAEDLDKGLIMSLFQGRMEWGARALGNRSIIADGRKPDVMARINEAIKNRDFWMPFAPSVLAERVPDYFESPRDFFSPYMVMAFPSKPVAQNDLKAGLHPYDHTGRVQAVTPEFNEGYYKTLKAFEKKTGVGGVLNTSFNIHGEAIVRTPQDAVETLLNSGLDALAIGSYMVYKKS